MSAKTYADHLREQREYHALCDKARSLGLPVSLDNPRSPRTVADLNRDVAGAVDEASGMVYSDAEDGL